MKKNILIILFSLFLFDSCTITGYFIGDYSTQNSYTNESSEIIKIDSGQTITVKLAYQKEIKGKYLGFIKVPYEEYLSKFNNYIELNNKNFVIPKLGDDFFSEQLLHYSLCFINQYKRDSEIEKILHLKPKFFGFDFNGFLFSNSGYENAVVIPASYFYENQISQSIKLTYDLEKILLLFMQKKFPYSTRLSLELNGKYFQVDCNDIEEITINEFPTNAFVGLAIGLGIDALIIYGISNAVSTGFGKFTSNIKL